MISDRERRLLISRTRAAVAYQQMEGILGVGALEFIRPDLARKVERLRGSCLWLMRELGRELERGDTKGGN